MIIGVAAQLTASFNWVLFPAFRPPNHGREAPGPEVHHLGHGEDASSPASIFDLMTLFCLQMVAAVSEQFNHLVERIVVIDCRYPYEYEGGHIKVSGMSSDPAVGPQAFASGTKSSRLFWSGSSKPAPGGPRGGVPPQNAHRPFLRRQTRGAHLPLRVLFGARPAHVPLHPQAGPGHERVPQTPLPRALHPEGWIQGVLPAVPGPLRTFIVQYLLRRCGFTASRPSQAQCEPQSYRPMHHQDFKEDLRKFRCKSRTWAGERSKREAYSRLKKP